MLRGPILVLKEGTNVSCGKSHVLTNINACMGVANLLRSTLGPRGMDKLIHNGGRSVVSNDGATLISWMDFRHPVVDLFSGLSECQDAEVGDGTTSIILLAAELLEEAKGLIQAGMSMHSIMAGYEEAGRLALASVRRHARTLGTGGELSDQVLRQCAETALRSKILAAEREMFAKMVVDAVRSVGAGSCAPKVVIKTVASGSARSSLLIDGVAFKKTFSYAGFEQQPKKMKDVKVILLNIELELRAEKDNAEVRIQDPEVYGNIVNAEWSIIFEKLDQIRDTGARVVFSRLPIGDLATQYFADNDMFCAGRVEEEDMTRTALCTGATILATLSGVTEKSLGHCEEFEEMVFGSTRYNVLKRGSKVSTATILVRGGAISYVEEAKRSLNDAIQVVSRAIRFPKFVGGGGAIEILVGKELISKSEELEDQSQFTYIGYARALECIPRALAQNCGMDITETLTAMKNKAKDGMFFGVDCFERSVESVETSFVWEPAVIKENIVKCATSLVCTVLSIDETISLPSSSRNPETGAERAMRA